jgi:hypothetical protein
VSLIREFLGACVLSGHRNAKIVTTAQGFTKGAHDTSNKAVEGQFMDSFELINRDKFLDIFQYSNFSFKYPWTAVANYWVDLWSERDDAEFKTMNKYLQ